MTQGTKSVGNAAVNTSSYHGNDNEADDDLNYDVDDHDDDGDDDGYDDDDDDDCSVEAASRIRPVQENTSDDHYVLYFYICTNFAQQMNHVRDRLKYKVFH